MLKILDNLKSLFDYQHRTYCSCQSFCCNQKLVSVLKVTSLLHLEAVMTVADKRKFFQSILEIEVHCC